MTPTAPPSLSPEEPFGRRLRQSHVYFGVAVWAIGVTVLAGWATGNTRLQSVAPGMISMKVNTALSLVLLATTLVGINRPTAGWRAGVRLCLVAAAAIAVLTLAEYVSGADLRIDNALFYDHASPRFPGRLAPATALALLGLDVALLLVHVDRGVGVAQALLFVTAVAPLTTLGGYLYGTPGLYKDAPYPVIALHTATALMLLCLGGLFARADRALMGIVTSSSLAGSVARKLLPAAVGLPLLTGLLVLAGQRAGVYTAAFASALLVACCVLFFTAAVCWTITLLWRTELSRARVEQELRLADRQANRLKDEFLSVISHELRTPLNAILGWSQILQAGPEPAELGEGLATIERNARAQVRIIEDLLDMGRVVNGKIRLDVQAVDLVAIVDATLQTCRPAAEAKGLLVVRAFDVPSAPCRGDAGRLQQVIANLLSNAVKFTPAGGTVRVFVRTTPAAVEVGVADTGEGIPASFLPSLFGRFRQADASTTRRFGGLGLGLSIAKQLVELHGGSIRVHSDGPGRGSTFTVAIPTTPAVTLPTAPASAPATAAADGAPPPATLPTTSPNASACPPLRGVRVLVVDDEPDARDLLRRVLRGGDAVVRVAASAAEAMALIDDAPADVLVSDIGMPGENGYTLIGRVRALGGGAGDVPALALTAFAREEDRADAIAAGFDDYLAKPVEPAALLAAVARCVQKRRRGQTPAPALS